MAKKATIYHNPKSSTSRQVLEMIEAAGYTPEIIEYTKAGWTKKQLKELFAAAKLTPRQALRTKAPEAEELGLLNPKVTDAKIIDAMIEHPVLVERPFVVTSCVADTDSVTPVLEPSCTLVEENLIEGTQMEVGPCHVVNGAWVPGDGATVCFAYRVDNTGNETPSELDNMSKFCVDEGFNLEFNIVRVVPAAPGVVISASCALSKDKPQDCPKL